MKRMLALLVALCMALGGFALALAEETDIELDDMAVGDDAVDVGGTLRTASRYHR